jgi:hypothetical protein
MGYQRDGDTVTLTITRQQFELIILALGMATGASDREYRDPDARAKYLDPWLALANAINRGNPDWRPYAEAT